MTKEFNLSEKEHIGIIGHTDQRQYGLIKSKYVKEFIKRLKEELTGNSKSFVEVNTRSTSI